MSGVGGYDQPITADAMIRHRDGIVGPWQGSLIQAGPLGIETPALLERWEPGARAAVYDFELLSHLNVTWHDENFIDTWTGGNRATNDSLTLWHIEIPSTGVGGLPPPALCSRIASVIRPTPAIFNAQLVYLEGYADLREDRAAEILAQMAPPLAFWSSVANLHPDRTRWTIELLDVALRLARFVEMRLKHGLACRRPLEYSPQVQPMILTPGHGTLPSGHATEAHIVAYLLWRLLEAVEPGKSTEWCTQLMRQAARIAINRTVAGVHFPVDSFTGQFLGLRLGEYLIHRCRAPDTYDTYAPWRFDGERYVGADDFDWRRLYDAPADTPLVAPFTDLLGEDAMTAEASPVLHWLWDQAMAEWP